MREFGFDLRRKLKLMDENQRERKHRSNEGQCREPLLACPRYVFFKNGYSQSTQSGGGEICHQHPEVLQGTKHRYVGHQRLHRLETVADRDRANGNDKEEHSIEPRPIKCCEWYGNDAYHRDIGGGFRYIDAG